MDDVMLFRILEAMMKRDDQDIWFIKDTMKQAVNEIAADIINEKYISCTFDSPLGIDARRFLENTDIKRKFNISHTEWEGRIGTRGTCTVFFPRNDKRYLDYFITSLPSLTNYQGYHIVDSMTEVKQFTE